MPKLSQELKVKRQVCMLSNPEIDSIYTALAGLNHFAVWELHEVPVRIRVLALSSYLCRLKLGS